MRFARRLTISTRSVQMVSSLAMIGLAATCAPPPPGSDSPTVHSCSPNYIDENEYGSLSVQQPGPRSAIQWGVFPELSAARYVVSIYIGSKIVDGKNQNYPPHGSLKYIVKNKHGQLVPRYKSGQIFKIVGTSYDGKGQVVQQFFIKCRLV